MIFRSYRSIKNKLLLLVPYGNETIWYQAAHTLKNESSERNLKVLLRALEIPGFSFGDIFLLVMEQMQHVSCSCILLHLCEVFPKQY